MRKARAVNKVRMGGYLSASIFVATVTNEMVEVTRLHENGLNVLVILGSEAEIKHPRVISMMVGDAESHPHDDSSYSWTIENVAHCHIGNADTMRIGNLLQHPQQLLEQLPASPGVDHLFVLPQTGRVERGTARLGLPKVGIGQQATTERPIREQRYVVLLTEWSHAHLRSEVDERILHLIRHNPDAVLCDGLYMGRVKVGEGEVF